MHSNNFEQAFADFLNGNDYDRAENALFALARLAFAAGWQAAGGAAPQPVKIFQIMPQADDEAAIMDHGPGLPLKDA